MVIVEASRMSARDELAQLVIVDPFLKDVLPPPAVRSCFPVASARHACSAPIHPSFFLFMTPP